MQFEVASRSNNICQEMLAIGELEYEKFVWIRGRTKELNDQVAQLLANKGLNRG